MSPHSYNYGANNKITHSNVNSGTSSPEPELCVVIRGRPTIITKSLGSHHYNHNDIPKHLLNVSEHANDEAVKVFDDENTVFTSETGPFPVTSLLSHHDKIQIEPNEERNQDTHIYHDRLQHSQIQRTVSPVSSTYLDFGKMSVASSSLLDSPRVGQMQLPIQTLSTSYFSLPLQNNSYYHNIEQRRKTNITRPGQWSIHQQRQQNQVHTSSHNNTSVELQHKSRITHHHRDFGKYSRNSSSHTQHRNNHNSYQYNTLEMVYPLHARQQESVKWRPKSNEKFTKAKNSFIQNSKNLSTSRLVTLKEYESNKQRDRNSTYYDDDSDSLHDQSFEQLESFDTLLYEENRQKNMKNASEDPGCGSPTIDNYGCLSQSQRGSRTKKNIDDGNYYCFPDNTSEKEQQEKPHQKSTTGTSIKGKDSLEKNEPGAAGTYDVHDDSYTHFHNRSLVKECIDIDNEDEEDSIHPNKSNYNKQSSSTTDGCGVTLGHNFVKYMCTDIPESLNDARCAIQPIWNNTFQIRDTDIDSIVKRIEKVKYQMDEYVSTLHF